MGTKLLLWTDFETDGIENPAPLEVACILTDVNLQEISRYHALVAPSNLHLGQIIREVDDLVYDMHDKSGLWDDLIQFGKPETEVVGEICRMISTSLEGEGIDSEDVIIQMAGSGVERFDRRLVADRTEWRDLDVRLHYAALDVSSIRNFLVDLAPEAMDEELETMLLSQVPHRAMLDVEHHLACARAVRTRLETIVNLADLA